MSLLHISIKEILQKRKQLVKYTGNLDSFSPYSVTKQTAIVLLQSRNVESYTKTKPETQSDSTVNYGTFGKKSPFSQMHFENHCQYIGTLLPPNEFIYPTCIVYSSNLKYVDSLYIFFNNL